MVSIFISYRRADGGWGGLLANHLESIYREEDVFRDIEDIDLGVDFWEEIRGTIQDCRAFLLVIGPGWLDGEPGQRRIDSESDWLRKEILLALDTGVPIIPVLFGGARMPGQADLPADIAAISRRNALDVSEERRDHDFGRLVDRLNELLGPSPDGASSDSVVSRINRMEFDFWDLLDRTPEAALAKARETLALIDRFLPVYPNDAQLRIRQGYVLKNEALALKQLLRGKEALAVLNDAERIFRNALEENQEDAGAWNGLGSICATRGGLEDLEEALVHIDRALAIAPDYAVAQKDRDQIVRVIESMKGG